MSTEPDSTRPTDPGLEVLVTLLHLQGVAADAAQIAHRLGTDRIGASEMLRCARDLGLKARAYWTEWQRLGSTPLPAIASQRDGGFLLVAKAMTRDGTTWSGVTISWDDGDTNAVRHNDMAQVERVPVKV